MDIIDRLKEKYPKWNIINAPISYCRCKGSGEISLPKSKIKIPCLCVCLSGEEYDRIFVQTKLGEAARRIRKESE